MLVDSHVNLHGDRYAEDLADVLERAREARVGAMLAISDRLDATSEIAEIIKDQPHIWRSVGVHPHHAKDYADLTATTLIDMATDPKVIGIGECGLDYYYEYSDREMQEPVFLAHINAAQETGLPLIIHTRNADDRMAEMLEKSTAEKDFPILLHCFTGGENLLRRGLALDAYVSFSGIVSFKKAEDVKAAAKIVPSNRLLIETDCPFLAPVPHRGKRNEPSFLPHVAQALANTREEEVCVIEQATTENFFRLFQRAQRPS